MKYPYNLYIYTIIRSVHDVGSINQLFWLLYLYREFAKTIKRPFSVFYNPYTQSIDLLKDTRSIENVVQDLRCDLTTVCDALGKMNKYLGI